MAIRLELVVDDKGSVKLTQFTTNVNKQFKNLENQTKRSGAAMTGVFSSLTSAVIRFAGPAALLYAAKNTLDFADNMRDLSRATGESVETLSLWDFIAKQSGTTTQAITNSWRQLGVAALQGDKAFQQLGIRTKDTNGNLRSAQDLFIDVADAVSRSENKTEAMALASQVLGRNVIELGSLLNEGRAGIDKMTEAARKSGAVISTQFAEKADAANDALVGLTAAGRNLLVDVLTPVLPPLTTFIEKLSPALSTAAEVAGGALKVVVEEIGKMQKDLPELSSNQEAMFDIDRGWITGAENIKKYREELEKNRALVERQAKKNYPSRGLDMPIPQVEIPDGSLGSPQYTAEVMKVSDYLKQIQDAQAEGKARAAERAAEWQRLHGDVLGVNLALIEQPSMVQEVAHAMTDVEIAAQGITQNIAGAMTSAIMNINSQTKVFKSIVSAVGRAILQEIVSAFAQAIAKAIFLKAITAGLGLLGFSGGGVVGGYARGGLVGYPSGGIIGGGIPIRTRTGDNRLIAAQTGEGILTREATARVGGAAGIAAINRGKGAGGNTFNLNISANRIDERYVRRELVPMLNDLIRTTPLELNATRLGRQ